jgi:hypothetical protein
MPWITLGNAFSTDGSMADEVHRQIAIAVMLGSECAVGSAQLINVLKGHPHDNVLLSTASNLKEQSMIYISNIQFVTVFLL